MIICVLYFFEESDKHRQCSQAAKEHGDGNYQFGGFRKIGCETKRKPSRAICRETFKHNIEEFFLRVKKRHKKNGNADNNKRKHYDCGGAAQRRIGYLAVEYFYPVFAFGQTDEIENADGKGGGFNAASGRSGEAPIHMSAIIRKITGT